jgi:hypothetical protein
VISLDLKPIYNKDDNSLKWDLLWQEIYEQLPEIYLKEYFGFEDLKNKFKKQKNISLLKENYKSL